MSEDNSEQRFGAAGSQHRCLPTPANPAQKSRAATVNNSRVNQAESARLVLQVPPFSAEDPQLWFALLETQFTNFNIKEDRTKYKHFINRLDMKNAQIVRDIILNPPTTNCYQFIKDAFISRHIASIEQKIEKILDGDRLQFVKPSELLRYIQELADSSLPDHRIRVIWMKRLPHLFQAVVHTLQTDTLDQLVELAERFEEISIAFHKERLKPAPVSKSTKKRKNNRKSPSTRQTTDETTKPQRLLSPDKQRADHQNSGKNFHNENERLHTECCPVVCGPLSHHSVVVTARNLMAEFIVDTGSNMCMYPNIRTCKKHAKTVKHRSIVDINRKIYAANGTLIKSYGQVEFKLDLGLNRIFPWRFLIADVKEPIIGMDFLRHYNLMIDCRNRRLIAASTE